MRMPPFCTHWPESIDEACDLARGFVESGTPFDWVAGGTDLLANYKWHLEVKPHVISLARIPGLDLIDSHEIGAMARLEDLVHDDRVHPLIAQAAGTIASSLIRRNATLGGNLCLDTRCFWYNQSEEWRMSIDYCHKADCGTGADCRVISPIRTPSVWRRIRGTSHPTSWCSKLRFTSSDRTVPGRCR